MAVLVCGFLFLVNIKAHANWINMTPGSPVSWTGNFAANYSQSMGEMLPCRVSYEGGIHPGWTGPGLSVCSFGWGGVEHQSATYQLWVDDWEPASNGNVPANAIPLGYETNAPSVVLRYACYATAPNGLPTSGKVGTNIGGCDYPWGGAEQHATSYHVLVDSSLSMVESTGGPKLTVDPIYAGMTGFTSIYYLGEVEGGWDVLDARVNSGVETDGELLAFCTEYYADGFHPGKMSWELGGCDLSFGGAELDDEGPNIEIAENWQENGSYSGGFVPIDVPIPYNSSQYPGGLFQSAVIGGQEADGTHFYLCAADNPGVFRVGPIYSYLTPRFIPGKVRPGLGGCSIAANGEEIIVPNYEVLLETYTKPAP